MNKRGRKAKANERPLSVSCVCVLSGRARQNKSRKRNDTKDNKAGLDFSSSLGLRFLFLLVGCYVPCCVVLTIRCCAAAGRPVFVWDAPLIRTPRWAGEAQMLRRIHTCTAFWHVVLLVGCCCCCCCCCQGSLGDRPINMQGLFMEKKAEGKPFALACAMLG